MTVSCQLFGIIVCEGLKRLFDAANSISSLRCSSSSSFSRFSLPSQAELDYSTTEILAINNVIMAVGDAIDVRHS